MPLLLLVLLFITFTCWGSFLNVLAYRLIRGLSFITPRSTCPTCKHILAWYDLIPLFSWIYLKGACRYCAQPISYLYPLIELLSGCTLTALICISIPTYFFGYFTLFSALIVSVRTDFEHMLISQYMTLYLIPLGFTLSALGRLPITFYTSLLGALGGYLFLYLVGKIFFLCTGKQGIGEGDFDLLALIGAFTGPLGCWTSIFIGSIFGSCIGIGYMLATQSTKQIKIPFGPFLALGAMAHVYILFLM